MPPQVYNWTCAPCSYTWVIGATGTDPTLTREQAIKIIRYPDCVNETYGLMSAECMINAFKDYGLTAVRKWCTFDDAYAICGKNTGVINPLGMYHFMAIRGVSGSNIWVANSAPGYLGVWDTINRDQFNRFSPVQVIYLV